MRDKIQLDHEKETVLDVFQEDELEIATIIDTVNEDSLQAVENVWNNPSITDRQAAATIYLLGVADGEQGEEGP